MTSLDLAVQAVDTFTELAESSPLRQVRSEMRRRAQEWKVAAEHASVDPERWEIDLAGSIAPGDRVLIEDRWDDGAFSAAPVLRVLHRDGQTSIHCTDPQSGRDLYFNFAGPTSPVVVQR